jgi:hypothetical protein
MEEPSRFQKAVRDLKQIYLRFGNEELSAPKLKKPHEQDKTTVGRMLYEHLSALVEETARPSLMRNIYDALSLKPGLFGIGLDLKVLLESTYPELKDSLNKVRLKRPEFEQLRIFVGTGGTRLLVPVSEAKEALGEKLYMRLLDSGIVRVIDGKGNDCALVHDLVAQIIVIYSN